MALIKCSECGQQISDKANVCPKCGCPIGNPQPCSSPSNGMSMLDLGNAIYDCFTKKYFVFSGRSRRSEYFPFLILVVFVYVCCRSIFEDMPLITFIIAIVLDIPLLAVTARRLHDVGRSGWWMLCPILPIFWMFKDSDVGTNEYGVSPKYPD